MSVVMWCVAAETALAASEVAARERRVFFILRYD
jgi:isoleucyl-tRNA synthetase